MKVVKQHNVYGKIVYNESDWTGKKTITINGKELTKTSKTGFIYDNNGTQIPVTVEGNFWLGSSIKINNEKIELIEKSKWYEIACALSIFILILIWGNVPALCAIVPVVGGAIGGLVSAVFAMFCLIFMKRVKSIWLKLLIWLGFMGVNFAVCYGIAMLMLSFIL
ncbi:MAG: hypothetical protein J6C13_01360 [Clostridia bacterium]|nr:hypothetical protein [Clostridia bacterium]